MSSDKMKMPGEEEPGQFFFWFAPGHEGGRGMTGNINTGARAEIVGNRISNPVRDERHDQEFSPRSRSMDCHNLR